MSFKRWVKPFDGLSRINILLQYTKSITARFIYVVNACNQRATLTCLSFYSTPTSISINDACTMLAAKAIWVPALRVSCKQTSGKEKYKSILFRFAVNAICVCDKEERTELWGANRIVRSERNVCAIVCAINIEGWK